jgi:shikimate dehydrogenase
VQLPTTQPIRLVLLGDPVEHSLSPVFQNAALRDAKLRSHYEVLHTRADELANTIDVLRRQNAAGNVTVPHKEAFAAHCDVLSDTARRIGAVNTFWFANNKLVGDNTDIAGAAAALDAVTSGQLAQMSCLMLGAGGSAAAVLAALEDAGVTDVQIVARNEARARAMVDRMQGHATVCTELPVTLNADLVINTTPIGLVDDAVPIDVASLPSRTRVLDLVYRRGGTALVRAARARGLVAHDGLRMLVEQGAHAFERWFGVTPDRDVMWRALGDLT